MMFKNTALTANEIRFNIFTSNIPLLGGVASAGRRGGLHSLEGCLPQADGVGITSLEGRLPQADGVGIISLEGLLPQADGVGLTSLEGCLAQADGVGITSSEGWLPQANGVGITSLEGRLPKADRAGLAKWRGDLRRKKFQHKIIYKTANSYLFHPIIFYNKILQSIHHDIHMLHYVKYRNPIHC